MAKPKTVLQDSSVTSAANKKVEMVEPVSLEPEMPQEIIIVPPDNHIFIFVDSISNIRPALISQESAIKLRLQFGDNFVSYSPVILFSDFFGNDTFLGWSVSIPCLTTKTEHLDFLTANPVFISVAEIDAKELETADQSPDLPAGPQDEFEFNPFAFCNLDLLPLILGESEHRQTLLLEIERKSKTSGSSKKEKKGDSPTREKTPKKGATPTKDKGGTAADQKSKGKSSKSVASSKDNTRDSARSDDNQILQETPSVSPDVEQPCVAMLPRISITASVAKPILLKDILEGSNLMFITIESIYNLPQNVDWDLMEFQAGTLIPTEFDREQVVLFGNGILKQKSDKERMKRWIHVNDFPGKSACSQYAISDDLYPVRNKLNVDLCHVMSSDRPRIEWNKLKRSWIPSSGVEYLAEYVYKHNTWMLEVMITPKAVAKKSSKVKDEAPVAPSVETSMHYVAFFDVSKLSYPGIHGARCAGQLFTYCKDKVVEKCGCRSQTVLSAPPLESEGKSKVCKSKSKPDKKGKIDGESKSKGSKKGSSKKGSAIVEPTEVAEVPEEVVPCEAVPWVDENGNPVFVVLELEVMNPLKRAMTKEELFGRVSQLIPIKRVENERELAARKAGADHTELIHKLVRHLTKEYRKFIRHRRKKKLCVNTGDQNTKDFYHFLKENSDIASMKEQLATSLNALIKKKFGYDISQNDVQDVKVKHKFASELYELLCEEVNSIINTVVDTVSDAVEPVSIPDSQLRMLVVEARMLGFATSQRELYSESLRRQDADRGTQFLHSSQCDDVDTALVHTLQVLTEDGNSKEAILLYAVLLTKKGDFKTARLFFQALVTKHPESLFSGYMYSLFYIMTGNATGAEVVWETTRKITARTRQPAMTRSFPQLLDWDPNMYELKSIHLKCVQILLYVRIFTLNFAYLALERELKQHGRSEPYYYFLAVCHFRDSRYEEACKILEDILVVKPRQNHIRRLLGHCQFEMGCREKATLNYEFVVESSTDGSANHLVNIRLGDHYLECENYKAAKAIFFESCRYSPTAKSWLGVGIACYMLGDFKESERALTEANVLDRTMAMVWGYLTLVCLQLRRQEQFEQCYCRAVRYHLEDEKVMNMINDLMFLNGFRKPYQIHSKK